MDPAVCTLCNRNSIICFQEFADWLQAYSSIFETNATLHNSWWFFRSALSNSLFLNGGVWRQISVVGRSLSERERWQSLDRNGANNDEQFFTSNLGARSIEQCSFGALANNFSSCYVLTGWRVIMTEPMLRVKTGGGTPLVVTLIVRSCRRKLL